MKLNEKIIFHIDLNQFFCSVAMIKNPRLRGKAFAIGRENTMKGVVSTASYEARKYGIHSAMPSSVAYKKCPYAYFVWPRFDVYQKVSLQIREIFFRYTDLVEPLSLDEAFLDVTNNKKGIKYATEIAKMIKADILRETGLTSSAGVSYNKFLAKLASDYNKPNGLKVITPDNKQDFLDNLPINKFYGIGKVTERKLRNLGVNNGYDLRQLSLNKLENIFKNRGYMFYQLARGIDDRIVEPYRERKSVGSETTLSNNLDVEDEEVLDILNELCEDVSNRLKYLNKLGKTVTLKIKYDDFTKITRSFTLEQPIYKANDIRTIIYNLVKSLEKNGGKIRLLGVTISNLIEKEEDISNITIFEYIDNMQSNYK